MYGTTLMFIIAMERRNFPAPEAAMDQCGGDPRAWVPSYPRICSRPRLMSLCKLAERVFRAPAPTLQLLLHSTDTSLTSKPVAAKVAQNTPEFAQ